MSHFYLTRPSIREIKEKKTKRKINIDLAVLPSHDNLFPKEQPFDISTIISQNFLFICPIDSSLLSQL